jgi:uncharacterized protein YpuA (DUF1002 family)
MASTASTAAEKAAELGKRTSEQVAGVAREAADTTEEATRRTFRVVERAAGAAAEVQREVAQRSAEGTAELGQAFVDLLTEQTKHYLKTWTELTGAVDWDQAVKAVDWDRVARIQTDFLRVSLERSAQLTKRYFEVTQTVVTAAASTIQEQSKKAA